MITAIITLEEENSCHNDPVYKILHIMDTTTEFPQSLHCKTHYQGTRASLGLRHRSTAIVLSKRQVLLSSVLISILKDIVLSNLKETSSAAFLNCPLKETSSTAYHRSPPKSRLSSQMRQVLRPDNVLHTKESSSAAFLNCPLK